MGKNDIFNVFFREKPAMMLINLKNAKGAVYASTLAKEIDCTYSHLLKILSQMESAKLVNFDKKGRLKLLTITKSGVAMAEHIESVRNMVR